MVVADFIAHAVEIVLSSENNAGGVGGAIGGLLGGRRGAALGAITGGLKFKQVGDRLLLVDSRSGIQARGGRKASAQQHRASRFGGIGWSATSPLPAAAPTATRPRAR